MKEEETVNINQERKQSMGERLRGITDIRISRQDLQITVINMFNNIKRKDGEKDEKLKYFNGVSEKMIHISTEDPKHIII